MIETYRPRRLLRILAATAAAIPVAIDVHAALAQEHPANAIEEIVVTARKRKESIQDVPAAVSALSAAQLQRYDITNIEKLQDQTPTLTVTRGQSGSAASITIRGIGSSFTSIGIEQSVAVVLDGAYYGQGRVINEGFYDASQVEVLKGPQSLFFGKNSTAGVISITTNDPGPEFDSQANIGYEFTSKSLLGDGFVSVPLTDTLGLRLAVSGTDMFGGYVKDEAKPGLSYTTTDIATGVTTKNISNNTNLSNFPEDTNGMGRATLKWKPTDELTATLKVSGDHDSTDGIGWAEILGRCPLGGAQLAPNQPCGPSFVKYENNIPAAVAATDSVANRYGGQLYNDYNSYSINGNISYVLPEVNITSLTNFQHFTNQWADDEDNTETPSIFATEKSSWNAASEELRALTTFDFPVNVLAGVLYQNTRLNFNQNVIFAGIEDSAAPALEDRYSAYTKQAGTNGETYATYGQIIYKFLPDWELDLGARWTHETKKSLFLQPWVNPLFRSPGGPVPLFVQGAGLGADQLFTNLSPDATLTWKPERDLTLYAAYKTGYKSGGFSDSAIYGATTTVNDLAFRPETARGFEVGAKTAFLDDRLRLRFDGYEYRFLNLQVDFFNSPSFAYITENAGSAKTEGLELEGDYAPEAIEGLTFHGTANYNRARYSSFIAPCYAGETPALGCTLVSAAPALTPEQNLKGHATADAPKWTLSLGANYEFPIFEGFNFGISTDLKYSDSYDASEFGNPFDMQASYVNIDSTLKLATDDDQWQVAVIGKNLSNNFVRTAGLDSPSSGSGTGTPGGVLADQGVAYNYPRTIEARFTWRFTPTTPTAVAPAATPAPLPPAPPPPAPSAPQPEAQRAFQVFFDFDKSTITAAAASVIEQAAESIKAGHLTRIVVTGHTDTVGSQRYNQKLSERRAAAVKQRLIRDGIAGGDIATRGVGKTELLVPTPDGVREPQNRRAEIVEQ